MDAIGRAMAKGLHISGNEDLNSQTWEQFERKAEGKHIFMFGSGIAATILWEKYGDKYPLTGIIDNDTGKQGLRVEELIAGVGSAKDAELIISGVQILEQYTEEEIVVLVNSINYYEEIVCQLREMGIKHIFVILIMEANERVFAQTEDVYDDSVLRCNYAKKCCNFPIEKKKIVFCAFLTYADHGKYISERLLKITKELELVWLVNDMSVAVPAGVRLVYAGNWEKMIYEMETAGMWVFNGMVPLYIMKRPGQVYIETKHWASVTLKRFYLDSDTITDISENVALWKYNGKMMDYIFTGSKFDSDSCLRGFQPSGETIQVGSCRSDALFCEEELRHKVYRHYGVDYKVHTLLYAPTYRYKKDQEGHIAETRNIDMDYGRVKTALEQRFGGQWIILLRLHPGLEKDVQGISLPAYVIDVSRYSDSEELVAASDILISDYSSIMFEPAFVRKPVFLFATDKKEYIGKEYDFLIEYDELPFAISQTNDELIQCIEQFEEDEYVHRVDVFMDRYNVHEDGFASERAARFILGLLR